MGYDKIGKKEYLKLRGGVMNIGSIVFLIALLILDRFIKKKFPRFYKRTELPINIIFSLLVTVYCGFLIYSVYDVLMSGVSNGDKVFFVIFIGVIVSVYIVLVTFTWRRWLKERKQGE